MGAVREDQLWVRKAKGAEPNRLHSMLHRGAGRVNTSNNKRWKRTTGDRRSSHVLRSIDCAFWWNGFEFRFHQVSDCGFWIKHCMQNIPFIVQEYS